MINENSSGQDEERSEQQPRLPIFQSEPNKANAREVQQSREDKEEHFSAMKIKTVYDRLIVGKAAAWTAASTCVLCVFSYLLWQVSRDANQLAIATQAASVSVAGPIMVKTPNLDGKTVKGWSIIFTWVNSGNVPTRTAELQSSVYVGTASPSKGLDFNELPQDRIVTAVIAPKSAIQTSPDLLLSKMRKM